MAEQQLDGGRVPNIWREKYKQLRRAIDHGLPHVRIGVTQGGTMNSALARELKNVTVGAGRDAARASGDRDPERPRRGIRLRAHVRRGREIRGLGRARVALRGVTAE